MSNLVIKKYLFGLAISFMLALSSQAQVVSLHYISRNQSIEESNYKKYVSTSKGNTVLLVVDSFAVPERRLAVVLSPSGNVLSSINADTVAYAWSDGYIEVGRRASDGKIKWGLFDVKGRELTACQYKSIRTHKSVMAVQNKDEYWALSNYNGAFITGFNYTNMVFSPLGKVLVKNNQGVGLMRPDGTQQVEMRYKGIREISADSFYVLERDSWHWFDSSRTKIKTWQADSISVYNDTLYKFYTNIGTALEKFYLADSTGKIDSADIAYTRIEPTDYNSRKVQQNELIGLEDKFGKEIIPVKYYDIQYISPKHLKVLAPEVKVLRYGDVVNKNKKRWYLFDSTGKPLHISGFKSISSYQEGYACVQNEEGLWGFLDEKGKMVVPTIYKSIHPFKEGKALVEKNSALRNDYLLVDAKGKIYFTGKAAQLYYWGIIRYVACTDRIRYAGEPDTVLHYPFHPDRYNYYQKAEYGYIRVFNGSYKGILNSVGNEVVQAYQDTLYAASTDTFFLYKRNDGRIGYSDRYGNTCLSLTNRYEQVQALKDGYSKFKKDGLYGFIDPYGNVQVAPKYTACESFYDGMAAVFLKGKWAFIDKEEKLCVQPYYREVQHFRNGFAPVKVSTKWIFIDKKGTQINSTAYDNFWQTASGKYIVQKNKRWGITSTKGKELLSPKYDYIEELGDSYYLIKKDGKFGVMDEQENIVLYYQYDSIQYDAKTKRFLAKTNGEGKVIVRPN